MPIPAIQRFVLISSATPRSHASGYPSHADGYHFQRLLVMISSATPCHAFLCLISNLQAMPAGSGERVPLALPIFSAMPVHDQAMPMAANALTSSLLIFSTMLQPSHASSYPCRADGSQRDLPADRLTHALRLEVFDNR